MCAEGAFKSLRLLRDTDKRRSRCARAHPPLLINDGHGVMGEAAWSLGPNAAPSVRSSLNEDSSESWGWMDSGAWRL